jgi:hypothetical protein
MARTQRHFLDRPIARGLAALVLIGSIAALAYLERDRLGWAEAEGSAADDPFARCFAERSAQIDRMQDEGVIEAAQAALFKTRAEAMCRAQTEGGGRAPLGGAAPGAPELRSGARDAR